MLRRTVTSAIIKQGPRNPVVRFLIARKCKPFGVSFVVEQEFIRLIKDRREMRLALKHFVYAPDMAKDFNLYFSQLVPLQGDKLAILDYSTPGILQTYARSGLQFELSSFPEEDEAIESYFHWYRPSEGDVVFDIGAHCGVSTYSFSKLVGEFGKVYAFEPDPMNFYLLTRNIQRHNLNNVVPLQIAVAGTRGQAPFSCEESIGSSLVRHSSRDTVGKVVMVPTVTLEDAFRQWGPPRFCKMDIEGAEMEVIGAARDFLSRTNCQFSLDTHHVVDGSFTNERVENLFRDCGYEALSSESGMKTTWARPTRLPDRDIKSLPSLHATLAP